MTAELHTPIAFHADVNSAYVNVRLEQLDAAIRVIARSVKAFGAVGNGSADDTAAIQAAIDAVMVDGSGTVWFPPGAYRITAPLLSLGGAVLLRGTPSDTSSNFSGGGSSSRVRIVWDGADGETMFTLGPSSVGDSVWGGGSIGIDWDGSAAAATALHFDNTRYARFNGHIRNVTGQGLLIDSASGSPGTFSANNIIERLHFIWGVADACKPAHGIVMDGNGSDTPATQQYVIDAGGLVYDGALIRSTDTDNSVFLNVRGSVQSGGSGHAVEFWDGPFHASANLLVYVTGPVHFDDGIYNRVLHHLAEIGSFSGGGDWHGVIQDYVTGKAYGSTVFPMRKRIWLAPSMFVADANTTLVDHAFQWPTTALPNAVYSRVAAMVPCDHEITNGFIEGVVVHYSCNGSGGDVGLTLKLSTQAEGGAAALVGPERSEDVTVPQSDQYEDTRYLWTPSGGELAVSAGDKIAFSVQRRGADVDDTATDALLFMGAEILYRSTGPDSPGAGTFTVPEW